MKKTPVRIRDVKVVDGFDKLSKKEIVVMAASLKIKATPYDVLRARNEKRNDKREEHLTNEKG